MANILQEIQYQAKGVISILGIAVNTVICTLMVCLLALFKFITWGRWRDFLRRCLAAVGELWIANNNRVLQLTSRTDWQVRIPQQLNHEGCYLVSSNHQSWVDIFALQRSFNRKLPFMRFFLKRILIWVPVIGIAWWALDFPFMRRYSKAQIAKNPALKGKDLQTAAAACEKFKTVPVAMMNFVEGTRFSPARAKTQGSPYTYLLKPRLGGLGQVLYSFNDQLQSMIDVTIVYPDGAPSFWQLLCGRASRILVHAREVQIPAVLRGKDFRTNTEFRKALEVWVNEWWEEKDQFIGRILAPAN